jgi:hypothetical protein
VTIRPESSSATLVVSVSAALFAVCISSESIVPAWGQSTSGTTTSGSTSSGSTSSGATSSGSTSSGTTSSGTTSSGTTSTGVATPSIANITGVITSATASIVVTTGDQVLVVNPTGNVTVGAGSVAAADGTYLVSMSAPDSLNGVSLTMEYVDKAGTFQLLHGTTPVSFLYEGSFPFPATITENLVIGSAVSKAASTGVASTGTGTTTTPTTTGVVCPCGLPNCDVNGDGIFDEADIRAIQDALISRNPNPRADVNGDGVVNIMDLLDALRALAQLQMNPGEGIVAGSACASSGTTTTGTTTTGTTTTGTTTTGSTTTGTTTSGTTSIL